MRVSGAAINLLACHPSIYLFRAVWVHSHQKNMMKGGRWTILQVYNKIGLLGPIIFYTKNKPQCYLVRKGSNWYLHKLCCNHGKLQGEILSPLRPVGNSEEFEGIMISYVVPILRLSALYKARSLVLGCLRLCNFLCLTLPADPYRNNHAIVRVSCVFAAEGCCLLIHWCLWVSTGLEIRQRVCEVSQCRKELIIYMLSQ